MPDKEKKSKPTRKDVIEAFGSEKSIYNKGEYGTVTGEGITAAMLYLPNKDEVLIKEGAHVSIKNYDPKDNALEFLSYDIVKFFNPRNLPFTYFVEGKNTYAFLKDGENIVSSVKLIDYTYKEPSFYSLSGLPVSISENGITLPRALGYGGAKKIAAINQLEELLTTGASSEAPNKVLLAELKQLGQHLKEQFNQKIDPETSLEIEKVKKLLEQKSAANLKGHE